MACSMTRAPISRGGDRARRGLVGRAGADVAIEARSVWHFGLTNRGAVHVLEVVPTSPAARAGIEVGDRLIAIDDAPINGIDDLQRLLDSTWIGRDCEVTVLRRSSLVHLKLRPIEVPATGA